MSRVISQTLLSFFSRNLQGKGSSTTRSPAIVEPDLAEALKSRGSALQGLKCSDDTLVSCNGAQPSTEPDFVHAEENPTTIAPLMGARYCMCQKAPVCPR
jgi:hypothetical protein